MKNWSCNLFSVTEIDVMPDTKKQAEKVQIKTEERSYQQHLVRNELLGVAGTEMDKLNHL